MQRAADVQRTQEGEDERLQKADGNLDDQNEKQKRQG
jgi:hypothetical protein